MCLFYWISAAELNGTAQNASQRSLCSARFHCFQSGNLLCCAMKIIMYKPVLMTVYSHVVLHRGWCGVVRTQHNKQHQEQVEERFWTGMLVTFQTAYFLEIRLWTYYVKQRQRKCNDFVHIPVQWTAFVV